jgi:hypothetical protein
VSKVSTIVCSARLKICFSGYGCLDHFLEGMLLMGFKNSSSSRLAGDTVLHSWEVLAKILTSEVATGIVCDIGMHVLYVVCYEPHS